MVRSQAGPIRDEWLNVVANQIANTRGQESNSSVVLFKKIPCSIDEERLLGGIDLSSTLAMGKPIKQLGALAQADNAVLLIAMAERISHSAAAVIVQTIDAGGVDTVRDGLKLNYSSRFSFIALDESIDADDQKLPNSLADRASIILDFRGLSPRAIEASLSIVNAGLPSALEVLAAHENFSSVVISSSMIEALCATALAFGIDSMRAPILAAQVARAHAALRGRKSVVEEDAAFAVRVVIAPRARTLPQLPEDDSAPPPDLQQDKPPENDADKPNESDPPEPRSEPEQREIEQLQETILAAAIASLPPHLLESLTLAARIGKVKKAGTSGAKQRAGTRGKASGAFRKKPSPHSRIHLLETLRASIPWQRIRRESAQRLTLPTPAGPTAPFSESSASGDNSQRVYIRKDDFRYKRIEQQARSTIIFAIDASGSSALNRLAEAKGAIELLLAQCYVRRDQVAVIAFRGKAAEVILPPTRSLARAKRSLAGLPGGGGTPLAAALDCAGTVAAGILRKGETPFLVMLTDGRANVAKNIAGRENGGRMQAQQDARDSAQILHMQGLAAIVLDTSPQPHPMAQQLANDLGAIYMPLPRANSSSVSNIVQRAYQSNAQ